MVLLFQGCVSACQSLLKISHLLSGHLVWQEQNISLVRCHGGVRIVLYASVMSSLRRLSFSSEKLWLFLEAVAGVVGCVGLVYGSYVLMVERAAVPVCSLELLEQQEAILRAQQPQLTVEVTGAVKTPGVWQFERGQRVGEAIEKAGGFSQAADLTFIAKNLNLAKELTEGQKIYIPFEQEATAQTVSQNEPGSASQKTGASSQLISVNTASAKELQTLPGIGEARSQKIIENRPYSSMNELVERKVLSEGILDDIKGLIQL